MSQDHYVWLGPTRTMADREGPQVLMPDRIVAVGSWAHHLEPIRGSAYTLAVFHKDDWANWLNGVDARPECLGYTTVHALGLCNLDGSKVQSAKEWMAITGYKWDGPK